MTPVFGPNVRRGRLAFGNLVLARGRIVSHTDLKLPGRGEQRGLLVAEAELDGARFVFAVTHLGLDRTTRALQVTAISKALPADLPLVLVGDFNASGEELEPLTSRNVGPLTMLDAPPTFPMPEPTTRIDHVLVSEHWRVTRSFSVANIASDHAALVVDLELA